MFKAERWFDFAFFGQPFVRLGAWMIRLLGRLTLQLSKNQFPVPLEYAKASFEHIKRLRHRRVLARVKRVLDDYTLANDLDHQFGDVPVGLRKMLLGMIHGFALLGGPPRYEEQPPPIGRLLGRRGFKCYRYFSVKRPGAPSGAGTGSLQFRWSAFLG